MRPSLSIFNTRLMTVFLLGLASGLPLALTGTTLQAWLTESGVSLIHIGLLSMVGLPYAFKFVWAPLLDHYAGAFRGGRRLGWILSTQLGLMLALVVMSGLNPAVQMMAVGITAVLVAIFSATQDIAIDGYRTELLADDERGLGAAYFVFAYRLAMLISGGLALIAADAFGWRATYLAMAGFMGACMLPVLRAPHLTGGVGQAKNVGATALASLAALWQRQQIGLLLAFVVLYKLGDALALSLMTNFLLHGLNFTLTQVGLVYKTVSFVATIAGAIVGGLVLRKTILFRALWMFGLAQGFSNLMFVWLAIVGSHLGWMATAIGVENFCSGLSTAAFFAFLMAVCDRPYAATQFAVLSAIASLGRVLLGPVASVMVMHWGWVTFYCIAFFLSFPGLLVLGLMKTRGWSYEGVVAV